MLAKAVVAVYKAAVDNQGEAGQRQYRNGSQE
jgi:hypothetical protein